MEKQKAEVETLEKSEREVSGGIRGAFDDFGDHGVRGYIGCG